MPDLKDTKPSVASLKRLHYTENALKEALRKYAIVPVVTRQAVKDDKLGDFSIPKDTKVVVYCGCCPFEHCPNVRPAIDVLKEMKFTNYYLLNLSHNLKTDWIDKGYPTAKP